jgi:hypothetical protein
MTNLPQNRRRHARISIDADYQLNLDGNKYTGKIHNISLSGAFLIMPEPQLTPSDTDRIGDLGVTLNNEHIQFKCEIVYVETSVNSVFPAGVGVAFCNQDIETAASIWNLALGQGKVEKDLFQVPDSSSGDQS